MSRKRNQRKNRQNNRQQTAVQNQSNSQAANGHINRKFKDSLFLMLFNNKENLLSLYNAINRSDYRDPEELEITTIDQVIYMGIKNDVSFLIGSDMNLYEAQSTRNPNMPLRGLIYFAHLYEGYVSKNQLNLYGSRLIPLPTPRYIVLYSGTQEHPDYKEYHLTDAFSDKSVSCLECTAVVLNVNTGHNQEILDQCRLLYEYACFLETVRRYVKESSCTMEEAIDHAVTDCIRKGILAAFLRKHRAEVINVLLTEYDADLHMKATYEEGREDGLAEGRAEGRQDGLAEGRAEGRREGIRFLISSNQRHGISREDTLKDLMLEYLFTDKQAEEYLAKYWQPEQETI